MNTDIEAQNRNILVTGAASGIGAALCLRLARPGTRLFIHTRANRAGAEAVAEAVVAAGGPGEGLLGDLGGAPVAGGVIAAVAGHGTLGGVVATAGFAAKTPLAAVGVG
ncbi:MAG: SDR family NAD(P)-dependent oxidoreductase, partial [Alphaproteobacteria bacterium]|nr:SDR family NAD(P)-dependent oxidoreductase [Alphaproteobacteria bacterium]